VATKPVRPDVYAAFRGSRLWRTASDEAVRRLAEIASVSDVPRGTPLATEGEPAERFGVLVAGDGRLAPS